MSSYDTAALWSATQLATDQTKIGAAGLSVRQRKLLTLLSEPITVAQLAQSIALPIEDVHASLDRFAKLGLAQTAVATPEAFDPMQLRATPIAGAAIGAASSRMPMLIGIALAALAVVAAAAWMLRSGSSSTTPVTTAPAPPAVASQPAPDVAAGSARSAAAPPVASAATPASPQVAQATEPPPAAAPANTAAARAAAAQAAALAARAAATPPTAARATPATAAAANATTAPATTSTAVAALAPTTTSAPAPAVAAPVAAAPVVAAATPAAAVVPVALAAATPATTVATAPARAPAAAREIKLVTRVEPTFPRGFDTDSGTVRARLQVDARGAVTGVDIIEANPPRVFDRNVRTALQQWRYEPTGEAFSTLAEIKFSR